ncbi:MULTISPECIES: LuxR family transcriptional regulator [unclassified Bradyrhizobium]|uniref:helix-turn-helix transcriptional regulator n=1 Tax=unclassified Bradyrhizobium TaxID=2631580 RepID=UPI00042433B6|nr:MULTISPECIES: LuxR family transcriptional regulator [unclassified Bradyrhizobium]MCP3462673.1 LuxR family transcriptional regulator [Bradyrhizobium sp. CCGUVB23]
MENIRDRAFEFVEKLQRIPETAGIMDALREALRQHGFEYFCFSFVTLRADERTEDIILGDEFPDGWVKHYIENDYVHADPAVRHSRTATRPFRWVKEAPYDALLESRMVEMVQRARDWGLQDGYVVPVASPAGRLGQVWFGGHEVELPEHDLPALHFMALYAFDQVLRLRGTPDAPHIILSEREREVLTLAALGRTSDQIAEAMNITERTVKEHIKNCCKKLGAVTRTQAVMIAMRDRIIQP